jgi:2-oxoglutarate dehydrogenase E1 component
MLDTKKKMVDEGKGIDWATGEALAFGSLLTEGFPVRLVGQDSTRGTFSHRHSALINQDNEDRYYPLNNIRNGQAHFEAIDSMLSEYAVLGFEYGYSLAEPNALTLWEAQFGDFANGAQIIFDQYISSSALKWQRMSGITIFLPHGFEGQGPEHSSARLERYLELCADNNMQIANPTTPANLFHLLRRQVMWPFRIPLIVMTPKSLLRHPLVKSDLTDLSKGRFLEIIDDDKVKREKVRKILFCSGKIYYDLLEKQTKDKIDDVAIVRVEQLYPLPENKLKEVVRKYKNTKRWVWVQEEPENMGAWAYILRKLRKYDIEYTGRAARSSPATGSSKIHAAEQAKIVNEAFS